MPFSIFADSDVVISSLISSTGAAYLLLNQTHDLKFYISNLSQEELERVADRLNISQSKLETLVKNRLHVKTLNNTVEEAREQYKEYVLDIHDAHIVLGAKEVKARFLITYNTKHFLIDKIKQDFNIIVTTPANFLQYLRSLE